MLIKEESFYKLRVERDFAIADITNILIAAEGRYTFICRFCAHYKTKDCCDRDGKCHPEWRGVSDIEEE